MRSSGCLAGQHTVTIRDGTLGLVGFYKIRGGSRGGSRGGGTHTLVGGGGTVILGLFFKPICLEVYGGTCLGPLDPRLKMAIFGRYI